MPIRKRQDLYDLFATGNKPTHDDFVDLIDSMINIAEDGLGISEKGRPMEIVEQGDNRRLLDLSSSRDTPIWRFKAQSEDGNRSGLDVSSANKSRVFIRQDNGFMGINNDAPSAKLHILPDNGPALRVDDRSKAVAFVIGDDGRVGVGTDVRENYQLSVDGDVYLDGETTINKAFHAKNGVDVDGAKLITHQGLSVQNGATIESGLLQAKAGLTVNGPLRANTGIIVDGLPLEVKKGIIIEEGATIETGIFTVNTGLTVNEALNANAGMVVRGAPLVVKDGLNISGATRIDGEFMVNNGLTVEKSTLEANGQVLLGSGEDGTVTTNGELIVKKGIILENPMFRVEHGIIFSAGDVNVDQKLSVSGTLSVNGGLTVNDSILQATGQVILGDDENGDVIVHGALVANKGIIIKESPMQAQNGAVITGSALQAENGLTVRDGAIIEDGLLTVNEGVVLAKEAVLNANGRVNLGNMDNGVVSIYGELRAINGATISGADLQVQNGLLVNGFLNAPDESELGTVTIHNLNVDDITVTGSMGLTSVGLTSLSADSGNIGNLSIESELSVNGQCTVIDNAVLAGGRILATYEGTKAVAPKVRMQKGIVTGKTGHFDITVNGDKQVGITYNESSQLTNFITDWKTYQYTYPKETEGLNFRRIGTGLGRLKEEEIELIPVASALKEYRIANNGLKLMYIGKQPGTPQFVILKNVESSNSRFDFFIQDLVLGISCPDNDEDRTVNNLLAYWEVWKNLNQDLAADFEIVQTRDKDWQLNDLLEVQEMVPTEDVVRDYKMGELIIRNTSNAQNQPKLIVSAGVPSSGEEAEFDVSLDTLTIALGTVENTPKGVYTAWKSWAESGNETYGFEIVESADTKPIQVYQGVTLVPSDDTHSAIELAGIAIEYTGDNAETAKVILQQGADGFAFSIDVQNKRLTIDYPTSSNERTVSNLLTAWESVNERYGFEITGSSGELYIRQEEAINNLVAVIKEYEATTQGVDNITIRYTGPQTDTPGVIIQANETNDFAISITENQVLTIKYPQDRSGSVSDLATYWEGLTLAERDGFSLIRSEIGAALVDEANGDLAVLDDDRVFSQGIIRTNTVAIEGGLKIGDSSIEISGLSNSEELAENSDTLLSTQKAVKSYVDAGLALKADQLFVTSELGKKANQSFIEAELAKKADLTHLDDVLAKKADLTHVDAELAEKADRNYVVEELDNKADQIFVTTELAKKANQDAVTAELAKKADQVELSQVTEELQNKADRSTMLAALATKVNLAKMENISVGPGATITVDGIGLTADYSGLLQVMIAAADHVGAGLFALDGTESLIKIAGDGLSDQQDNPDTCNAYLHEGKVMLQNALTNEITAKVLYFGT